MAETGGLLFTGLLRGVFCMRHLHTPEGDALLKALTEARHKLADVQVYYQRALADARDAAGTDDSVFALKQAGRNYAQAVSEYTNASMKWLAYADRHLHPWKAGDDTP
jgi:hypothetical protein